MNQIRIKGRLNLPGALSAAASMLLISMLSGCTSGKAPMNDDQLKEFATQYTAAWNSQSPASVSEFFAEDGGTLLVNGTPAVGREAITSVARGFMTAFPDMALSMDALHVLQDQVNYYWTFTGTNTGPGGTGKGVAFSGYEQWTIGDGGLIYKSIGSFDNSKYQYQLEYGVGAGRQMDANEVRSYVRSIADDDRSRTNLHGCELNRCLIEPRKIRLDNSLERRLDSDPLVVELWLVLEEDPVTHMGYGIVFNDSDQSFGLASIGKDGAFFYGYYMSFWAVFDGM